MAKTPTENGTIQIEELRKSINGQVIGPGDAEYDAGRRVFLTGIDRSPAAIIRPANARDVSTVVSLARDARVELAVRSGGHSFAGYGTSDGGWVLDLSAMRSLDIDAPGRTAWAGAGITAAEYTSGVGAHDLVTGFGDSPTVGVGGLTLGGGVGFLHRKLGLTIDSLLAAEVVTADGRIVHTDEDNEPDLFWAIRGGGGNFGVVTRFRFRLHEVSSVVGGMLIIPATAERLVSFVEYAQAAGEELAGMINVLRAPPMPFIPADYHGRPILMGMFINIGDAESGERAFRPFRQLATPLVDTVHPMRYAQVYDAGEGPRQPAAAIRGTFVETFDRPAAETMLEHVQTSTGTFAAGQVRVLGGAVARVPADATAFAHRDRAMLVNITTMFTDIGERAQHEAWVGRFIDRLQQGEPGTFVSFLSDNGAARTSEAYPPATLARLEAIKQRYDPTNLFRLNLNIEPAGSAAVRS